MGYYINVEPGVTIYAEDINPAGKTTVVFLHGWPGDHNLFEYQFNQLPKRGIGAWGWTPGASACPPGPGTATAMTASRTMYALWWTPCIWTTFCYAGTRRGHRRPLHGKA